MLIYLVALIISPLLMVALFTWPKWGATPKWVTVGGAVLWVVTFQSMTRVVDTLYPVQGNDMENMGFTFFVTLFIFTVTISLIYKRRDKAATQHQKHVDNAVANAREEFFHSVHLNIPAPSVAPDPVVLSHITEITEHSGVVKGILYLGHIRATLDEVLASADALPPRDEDATNVAYSNGKYVYMYMYKQWFYAHIGVFLHNPSMLINTQAWIEGRCIRHFECFDTSAMGPAFSEYVAHLSNRPEMPSSEDLYEHKREDFADQLMLTEAIDIFKERIKNLRMELSKATNSEVIRQFQSVSELPNTNVRAKVIREEAEKRSEQMRKDNNTSEPFNDFPLTSLSKE